MTGPMLQPAQRWWDDDGAAPSSEMAGPMIGVPDDPGAGPGSDDGAARAGLPFPRRVVAVAAGASLLAGLLAFAGVFGWRAWSDHLAGRARSDCLAAVEERDAAWAEVSSAVDDAADALAVDASQVADPTVVSDLAALVDGIPDSPGGGSCPAGASVNALRSVASSARAKTESYGDLAVRVRDAAGDVIASRDARTLSDAADALRGRIDAATTLLTDSDGKVQEASTRDALSDAIDAAVALLDAGNDARAMTDAGSALDQAMTAVNDSVRAKRDADAKAEAGAAEAAAAQAQSSSGPSAGYPSGGYTPSYAPSYSGGSSSGSVGGWDVPAPGGDALPGADPSL